jgi:hypothetical protein
MHAAVAWVWLCLICMPHVSRGGVHTSQPGAESSLELFAPLSSGDKARRSLSEPACGTIRGADSLLWYRHWASRVSVLVMAGSAGFQMTSDSLSPSKFALPMMKNRLRSGPPITRLPSVEEKLSRMDRFCSAYGSSKNSVKRPDSGRSRNILGSGNAPGLKRVRQHL